MLLVSLRRVASEERSRVAAAHAADLRRLWRLRAELGQASAAHEREREPMARLREEEATLAKSQASAEAVAEKVRELREEAQAEQRRTEACLGQGTKSQEQGFCFRQLLPCVILRNALHLLLPGRTHVSAIVHNDSEASMPNHQDPGLDS